MAIKEGMPFEIRMADGEKLLLLFHQQSHHSAQTVAQRLNPTAATSLQSIPWGVAWDRWDK